MIKPSDTHFVSPFHSLERETVKQADNQWNNIGNTPETLSLKALANKILQRNKERNKDETEALKLVPSVEQKSHAYGILDTSKEHINREKQSTIGTSIPSSNQKPITIQDISNPHLLFKFYQEQIQHLPLPALWKFVLVKVLTKPRPSAINEGKWNAIIAQIHLWFGSDVEQLQEIIQKGWTIQEIFGCHILSLQCSYDGIGLLLLMQGKTIDQIKSNEIILKNSSGGMEVFRKGHNSSSENPIVATLELTSNKDEILQYLRKNEALSSNESQAQSAVHNIQDLLRNLNEDERMEFEERAAILEHEGGLPRIWAEAFVKLLLRSKPDNISKKRWQTIINQISLLLDVNSSHLKNVIKYGWGIDDIFGCHRITPEQRYDGMGLLMLLQDREIVEVKKDVIVLKQEDSLQTYRKSLNCHKSEQSSLMEL